MKRGYPTGRAFYHISLNNSRKSIDHRSLPNFDVTQFSMIDRDYLYQARGMEFEVYAAAGAKGADNVALPEGLSLSPAVAC